MIRLRKNSADPWVYMGRIGARSMLGTQKSHQIGGFFCVGQHTTAKGLTGLIQDQVTDMTNRFGWVETFGANRHTVHDATATEQAKRVVQIGQTLGAVGVAGISNKAIRLNQRRWSQELVRVPPKRWARGRTTGAQNTLVQAI